jgi:hypothetical protein
MAAAQQCAVAAAKVSNKDSMYSASHTITTAVRVQQLHVLTALRYRTGSATVCQPNALYGKPLALQ